MRVLVVLLAGALALAALPAAAQMPEFGDDTSLFALNGECDDPRFTGAGMTGTMLLDEDRMHDATDCRAAWEVGSITLVAADRSAIPDFGDDSSTYANDGECDDPRFEGPGMTTTPLLDRDIRADATDCRAAWEAGTVSLVGEAPPATPAGMVVDGIDFGDDASEYANDGECDDKRFEGPGMTTTPLLDDDIGHDATDCFTAYEGGELWLAGNAPSEPKGGDDGKTSVRK